MAHLTCCVNLNKTIDSAWGRATSGFLQIASCVKLGGRFFSSSLILLLCESLIKSSASTQQLQQPRKVKTLIQVASALHVPSFPVAFWPFPSVPHTVRRLLLALLNVSANLAQTPPMSATDLSRAALLYLDEHPSLITPMTSPSEKEAFQPVGIIYRSARQVLKAWFQLRCCRILVETDPICWVYIDLPTRKTLLW